ncbi:MAG: tetratricopeptide repeat protein [Pyrinomonadaceae bacterium]
MSDSLRLLGWLIYAPVRAIRAAGARGRLLLPVGFALLIQTIYLAVANGPFYVSFLVQQARVVPESAAMVQSAVFRAVFVALVSFFSSAVAVALLGLLFIPVAILLASRRGGRVKLADALQRDFSRTAPAVFCAFGISGLWALVLTILLRGSGLLALLVRKTLAGFEKALSEKPDLASATIGADSHPELLAMTWLQVLVVPAILIALYLAIRVVFGFSRTRSFVIVLASYLAMFAIQLLMATGLTGTILSAPILVLMSFLVLRSTFLSTLERQRQGAAFQQAVTAADSAPFDSRAQYDLGLLLLQRGETAKAKDCFERAVSRDADDLDAHFQLGRIARGEGRWADAIKHFEPVVENDFAHADYEIWREVGATYLGAGQYTDAVEALERFLDHRPHDPEGWYELGRAQQGLGNQIEAVAAMHACIASVDAVAGEVDEKQREWRAKAEAFLQRAGK